MVDMNNVASIKWHDSGSSTQTWDGFCMESATMPLQFSMFSIVLICCPKWIIKQLCIPTHSFYSFMLSLQIRNVFLLSSPWLFLLPLHCQVPLSPFAKALDTSSRHWCLGTTTPHDNISSAFRTLKLPTWAGYRSSDPGPMDAAQAMQGHHHSKGCGVAPSGTMTN